MNDLNGTNAVTPGTSYYIGDAPVGQNSYLWNGGWYGWYGTYGTPPAHEHNFIQAREPYESTLFCSKCGATQRLKIPKFRK